MLIRVIDTETTGLPEEPDQHGPHRICEIGWQDIHIRESGARELGDRSAMLVDPLRPISIEAMAAHHITDAMVKGKPKIEEIIERCFLTRGVDVFAAHFADFDKKFFCPEGIPWIDTYKVGLRTLRDAPSHKNQALRYYMDLELDDGAAQPPHRAGPDAYVTGNVLLALLARASVEDMIRWSDGPALLVRIGFGEHRGKRWEEVPQSYLEWIVRNFNAAEDRDNRANAKYHLARLKEGNA